MNQARRLSLLGILLGPVWAVAMPASVVLPAAATVDTCLESLTAELGAGIDERVANVLPRIDDLGSKLLALRSYLRSGDRLAERWSWSQQQIAAYADSTEQRELQAEIERVRVAFERDSPEFELFVNPQVRSIDVQLASWNSNESVAAASSQLLADVQRHLAAASESGRKPLLLRLETFLQTYVPQPVPTVAAPGLSPHGQMRAVDFQVHRRGEIVAGPDSSTIDSVWEQGGWAGRLDAAVREASRRFVGPLASPREPWHYTYSPEAVADQ